MKMRVVAQVLMCVASIGCGAVPLDTLKPVALVASGVVTKGRADLTLTALPEGECGTLGEVTVEVNGQPLRRARTGGPTPTRDSIRCEPAEFAVQGFELSAEGAGPLTIRVFDDSATLELEASDFAAAPSVSWVGAAEGAISPGERLQLVAQPAGSELVAVSCWYEPTGASELEGIAFHSEAAPDGTGWCDAPADLPSGAGRLRILAASRPASVRCEGASSCSISLQFESEYPAQTAP